MAVSQGVITLEHLNATTPTEWVAALGGIFEHSPWVAQRALGARPYRSRLQLLDAMRAAVDQATLEEQLALIRAHPKLGLRGRAALELTPASAREQRRAGLAACTPAQLARLEQLNALYQEKSGFPFILAVRGHDPVSIIANLERRVANDSGLERRTALSQIGTIAAYRMADLVISPPGPEILAMLDRLTPAAQPHVALSASAMVREWMQAAGLDVCSATGGDLKGDYLVGRADAGEPHAPTLVAGACRDPSNDTLRYQGRAAFVIGIEAAQQLRHHGVRPARGLLVLARPEDKRPGDPAGLFDVEEAGSWIELGALAAANAAASRDADTIAIVQALHAADLGNGTDTDRMRVRRAAAVVDQGGDGAITVAAAERAVRALQANLGRVATAS